MNPDEFMGQHDLSRYIAMLEQDCLELKHKLSALERRELQGILSKDIPWELWHITVPPRETLLRDGCQIMAEMAQIRAEF